MFTTNLIFAKCRVQCPAHRKENSRFSSKHINLNKINKNLANIPSSLSRVRKDSFSQQPPSLTPLGSPSPAPPSLCLTTFLIFFSSPMSGYCYCLFLLGLVSVGMHGWERPQPPSPRKQPFPKPMTNDLPRYQDCLVNRLERKSISEGAFWGWRPRGPVCPPPP